MGDRFLISILGPTAVGKTSLAIEIAKKFNTEIISADSRQFYRDMFIGTARPSKEEMKGITHHFMGFLKLQQDYSAGQFEKDALAQLETIFRNRKAAVIAGGSGLYLDAIFHGIGNLPKSNPAIRKALNEQYEKNGIRYLQDQLKSADPVQYEVVDLDNAHRLIRALEVFELTGIPYSTHLLTEKKNKREFNTIKIGLQMDRAMLYDRINKRVDSMIEAGLVDEVKALLPYRKCNALKTLGYREILEAIDGKCTMQAAIEKVKRNTRRYAKRQITWFKRDEEIQWFSPNEKERIIAYISSFIDN